MIWRGLHIRHMVGRAFQRVETTNDFYRFQFPERPGRPAATSCAACGVDWNISLFHYRNYGSEYGRVLMGIQVPEQDGGRFQEFLDETGYGYTIEADNAAYEMFVGPG